MTEYEHWTIYSLASHCDSLFISNISLVESRHVILNESDILSPQFLQDSHARFNAWESYTGALAEEKLSLDRRLELAVEVRDMVLRMLQLLKKNLHRFKEVTNSVVAFTQRRRVTRSGCLLGVELETEYSNLRRDVSRIQGSIDGAVNRLHRLGMTIRQSSTGSLAARVKAFSMKHNSSSLEEVCLLIAVNLYPHAPVTLQRLLGRSVLERYLRLKYMEQHRNNLSKPRQTIGSHLNMESSDRDKENIEEPIATTQAGPKATVDEVDERPSGVEDDNREGLPSASVPTQSSKPSTFLLRGFLEKMGSRQPSMPASEASSIPLADTRYPQPPKAGEKSMVATCRWCGETYEKEKFQQEYWKHVARDLTPYICLAEGCSQSQLAFGKLSRWQRHMEERHNRNWAGKLHASVQWICDLDGRTFQELDALENHLRECHSNYYTESQFHAVARRSSSLAGRAKDICLLCGYDPTKEHNFLDEPTRDRGKLPTRTRLSGHSDEDSSSEKHSGLEDNDGGTSSLDGNWAVRKKLARHIAAHLTALSFMSLRLDAFREPSRCMNDDDKSVTPEAEDETSSGGMSAGRDGGMDDVSLTFEENPPSERVEEDHDLSGRMVAWKDNDSDDNDESVAHGEELELPTQEAGFNNSDMYEAGRFMFDWGAWLRRRGGRWEPSNSRRSSSLSAVATESSHPLRVNETIGRARPPTRDDEFWPHGSHLSGQSLNSLDVVGPAGPPEVLPPDSFDLDRQDKYLRGVGGFAM